MAHWKTVGLLSIALCGALWIAPGAVNAADGYTLESMKLNSASDLVDVCTVEPTNDQYEAALAFCYGFFEGAIRYHQAITGSDTHKELVCAPSGTTRLQAVDVFVAYMQGNPQYANEEAIDAIFRALMARWPCDK
ncbi:MAG: Rap1a/Tai family immunity protein [Halioglobus sp.]